MSNALPFRLAPPEGGQVDLLVIAAEHSGDQHAGRMVAGLLAAEPGRRVCALGGPALAAGGAQLLEDLTTHSTMGFAVFGRLSFYRTLMAEVVRWVAEHQPKAVCFVDSSGLNLRIAQKLFAAKVAAKAGGPTRLVYYISPQVWASRSGRRFKMGWHLDGLASIFPFEKDVYADTDVPVSFVGHPFVAPDYQPPVAFDPAGPVLLLPGSRQGLVARLMPVMVEAFQQAGGERKALVLYPSESIREQLAAMDLPANLELRPAGESAAPVGASAVLTTSGTMSMHCALAGIPGVVTYKTDPLTYWLGRLIVQVKFIGIANLLLGREMYPELIQGAASAAAMARELRDSLGVSARRQQVSDDAAELRSLLSQATDATPAAWLARQLVD
jgi:lipid-A-disaccharide synthase